MFNGSFGVDILAHDQRYQSRIRLLQTGTPGVATVEFQMDDRAMVEGFPFKIRLINGYTDRLSVAELRIGGVDHGSYRVSQNNSWDLERSSKIDGVFTFTMAQSAAGRATGSGQQSHDTLGLLEVDFYPELLPIPRPVQRGGVSKAPMVLGGDDSGLEALGGEESYYGAASASSYNSPFESSRQQAGHVGQSGQSSQRFHTVADLPRDVQNVKYFRYRLVAVRMSGGGLRPLTPPTPPSAPPTPWR